MFDSEKYAKLVKIIKEEKALMERELLEAAPYNADRIDGEISAYDYLLSKIAEMEKVTL
jgi:hypothetical protein